jgi:fibronectin-binding autotransporter adhesin
MKAHSATTWSIVARTIIVAGACLHLGSVTVRTATCTWDGGSATSGNWRDRVNWRGDVAPAAGDSLVFPSGVTRVNNTNDFAEGTRFHDLRFTGSNYVVQGNAILLDGDLRVELSSGNIKFYPNISLNSARSIYCYGSAPLIIYGDLDLQSHYLTVSSETQVELYGVISGDGGLIKAGMGMLSLRGIKTNSFRGPTTVNAGTLELKKTAGYSAQVAISGALTIGDGIGGADTDEVILGNRDQISPDSMITINSSGLLDLNGLKQEVGALTLRGGHIDVNRGELTLRATNVLCPLSIRASRITGSGVVDVTGGAFRTFDVADGPADPDLLISASLRAGYGGAIRKIGSGQMTLSGENYHYGETQVEEGILRLGNFRALGAPGIVSPSTVSGSGTISLAAVDIIDEVLMIHATNALVVAGPASWAGQLWFVSDCAINVTSGRFDLTGPLEGAGRVNKRGPGILRLSGDQRVNYRGLLWVKEGTLELGRSLVTPFTGSLLIGDSLGGVGADVVRLLSSYQLSNTTAVEVNSSGLLDLNGNVSHLGELTLNGGQVDTGSGVLWLNGDLRNNAETLSRGIINGKLGLVGDCNVWVEQSSFAPDLQINASVIGDGRLLKLGNGELSLAASNSFAGEILVQGGTLEVDHSHALGGTDNGVLVWNSTLAVRHGSHVGEEPLALGIGLGLTTQLKSALGSNSWAGPVVLRDNVVVDVNADTDFMNLSGQLSGGGMLTKTGPGILILSGTADNSNIGRTVVTAGTLLLNKTTGRTAVLNGLGIGDGAGGVRADVVRWMRDYQVDQHAGVTIGTSGWLDLNGRTDTIGSLSGSGNVNLGNGTLVVGYNNEPTDYAGSIGGAGGRLEKYGTGTLILSGSNAYTGRTLVYSGTLLVNGAQTSSPIRVSSLGTLGGFGSVGNITNYGMLAPGDGLGSLTCGNVVLMPGSTMTIELERSALGIRGDQLRVRGQVELGGATLALRTSGAFTNGDQIVIVNNDGAESIAGTFAGFPNNSVLTVGSQQFRITYSGGTGNDVVITYIAPPIELAEFNILGGNGDNAVGPNECDELRFLVHNRDIKPVTGIIATLSTATPGVLVVHARTAYSDIPPGETALNLSPFQTSTGAGFDCRLPVEVDLTLDTTSHGTIKLHYVMPGNCQDGGGACELCGDTVVTGIITDSDPTMKPVARNHHPSTCESVKEVPPVDTGVVRYHAIEFWNGASNACITVQLDSSRGSDHPVASAAYLGHFDPSDSQRHYLADLGWDAFAGASGSYSFQVPARTTFVVVVQRSADDSAAVDYQLTVAGADCRPVLSVVRALSSSVVLAWTTAAPGYRLEMADSLGEISPAGFVPVEFEPFVVQGKYAVTNPVSSLSKYYRLAK